MNQGNEKTYITFKSLENIKVAEGHGVAREKKIEKKISSFLAYDTPRPPMIPMSVYKKIYPNRFRRLAGYTQHI